MRKFMITLAVISGSLTLAGCGNTPTTDSKAENIGSTVETVDVQSEDANASANAAAETANDAATTGNAMNTSANSAGEAETAGSNGGPDLKTH